jgi:hypothetical protein
MSCRLWLRPAHSVRFTSLRDVSLAETGIAGPFAPAAHRGHAATRFMRGLRA